MSGEEELDLDQQLEALDLDTNFLDSASVDDDGPKEDADQAAQVVEEPKADEDPEPAQRHSQPALHAEPEEVDWVERTEIYSRHFKPGPKEREVLEEIASKLGVKSGLPKAGGGGGFVHSILGQHNEDESDPNNPQCQWNRLVNGKASKQTQNLPVSIVLQRGPVMYKDVVDEKTGETVTHHGCELILFTRGFLLAQKDEKSWGLFGKKHDVLVPLGSALWTDVKQIQTTAYQSILISCGSDSDVHFDVLPAADLGGCRKALQTAAIQLNYNCSSLTDAHTELGWQYRLCRTPWFTEAVTGEFEDLGLELSTSDSAEEALDQLDEYNNYAPLHYATRANHVDVMRKLLEAGANPNIEDGEGRTPMYYAERDQLPAQTIAVLTEFGATSSRKLQEEKKGELFGKVDATNEYRDYKRQEAEAEAARIAQAKAEHANEQMKQNLAAMHKRGEMIEELGDKATDLQDGAEDYADMAAKLKEKMKKKSVWGF